ncbi:MAG: hypothetical protein PWQ74_548 [Methanobacteriaceae archaeon]|nr:hypothetical protein [Methanobacteriaceae archaeon]
MASKHTKVNKTLYIPNLFKKIFVSFFVRGFYDGEKIC